MAKKRTRSSDSYSSSNDDDSSEEDDNSKSRSSANKKVVSAKIIQSSDDSSSSSDDDGEWNAKPKAKSKKNTSSKKSKKKTAAKKAPTKKKKKASSENEQSEDSSSSSDHSDSVNGQEAKIKSTPRPGRPKKLEEKEEGEVEDGSDYDDDDMEEFNDGLDENLMGDEEDRKLLSMMTEKEREQELFNRSEKREVLRTRFQIEKKLRAAKKKQERQQHSQVERQQSKSKKKSSHKKTTDEKASDDILPTSIDSSVRCYERRKNIEDKRKKDSIKVLQAEREKKKEKLKQKLRAADIYSDSSDMNSDSDGGGKESKKRTATGSSSGDSSSSDSASYADSDAEVTSKSKSKRNRDDSDWGRDSDQEEEEEEEEDEEEKEQFFFTRQHLNEIRLSRFKLGKFCFAPFFKNTIIGCFVRIGVGNLAAGPSYQVGQVLDLVETPRTYTMDNARTNKGLKLRIAKLERVYRMEYVSNQEFSEEEFNYWYAKMLDDRIDFPTKDFVERKKKEITDALCHNFSDREIEMIVNEKEKFQSKPVNYAMKKTQLLKEKEYAELTGDHDKVVQMAREIEKIENEAKSIERIRTKNIAGISFINERNRMKNIVIEDKDKETLKEEAKQQKDDPFTRRKCMPTMVHKVNKNKNAEAAPNNHVSTVANGDQQPDSTDSASKTASASSNSAAKTKSSAATTIAATESEHAGDLFSAHNFDINLHLDLDIDGSTAGSLGSSVLFSNGTGSKGFGDMPRNSMLSSGINRRLNLDEYKKKKGLI